MFGKSIRIFVGCLVLSLVSSCGQPSEEKQASSDTQYSYEEFSFSSTPTFLYCTLPLGRFDSFPEEEQQICVHYAKPSSYRPGTPRTVTFSNLTTKSLRVRDVMNTPELAIMLNQCWQVRGANTSVSKTQWKRARTELLEIEKDQKKKHPSRDPNTESAVTEQNEDRTICPAIQKYDCGRLSTVKFCKGF